MEKSKTLQISKSSKNSAPISQLYNKCQRNFSRQETQEKKKWEEPRWRRSRTGKTLSPPQIHQKSIKTSSKFPNTTSEGRQRTSGTQKSSPTLRKEVGKNIKDKKRDKRGRDGVPSQEGSLKKREVSKHQETFSLPNLCRALEAQRAT